MKILGSMWITRIIYRYIDGNKSWEKLNALLKLQNLLAKAKL